MKNKEENQITRPPVIVVMGHIDHGKSTLLDYIRKSNVVEKEAGGITQRLSAYEVSHKDEHGVEQRITFLDTPGHEAFSKMRERGASAADIAILVVSAEDGVKPQTVEAYKTIQESGIPYIVAINKIDRPGANIENVKIQLAENEIYLEDYGGKIPYAKISAKTGEGIDELLSLILILAELEHFTGNKNTFASGYVIEAHRDPKRGIEASLVIKDGHIGKGMFVVVEEAICATRIMENFSGKTITEAHFSSPIRLVGFDTIPKIGAEFVTFDKKSEAEAFIRNWKIGQVKNKNTAEENNADKKIIPIVLKADVSGSLEALNKEVSKITSDTAHYKVISQGVGAVNENDIKAIATDGEGIIIAFNVKVDNSVSELSLRRGISIASFDIIYKMSEWLTVEMENRKPKVSKEQTTGKLKILKAFSRTKERQILGGKVVEGFLALDSNVKIMRREFEIGKGKIVNLEKSKAKTSKVEDGDECGMMIEAKIEIAPGDIIESFVTVQK